MTVPRLYLGPHGELWLEGLDPLFVHMLQEVPELLSGRTSRAVERRLYPDPTEDPEDNRDWRRLMVPELKALVASARDIVAGDLRTLSKDGHEAWSHRVRIPPRHLNAWISAFNAARLTLAARHRIEEQDMEAELAEVSTPKEEAIWKIHVLGILQAILIEKAGI